MWAHSPPTLGLWKYGIQSLLYLWFPFFFFNYSKNNVFFFFPLPSVPSQFFYGPADFMALEIDILWPIIAFPLSKWSLQLVSNHLTISNTPVSSSFLNIIILVDEKCFSCFVGSVLCFCSKILSSILTSPCNFKFPQSSYFHIKWLLWWGWVLLR